MNFLELIKYIFSKQKPLKVSFQEKFFHFQKLLSANDDAHKYMSELSELIAFGIPFSRGRSTNLYRNLFDKTKEVAMHLTFLSNGKYKDLEQQVERIGNICDSILSPRIFCLESWDCQSSECDLCDKVKRIDLKAPYYYNMEEINQNHIWEVGAKMSRLGEIKNILGLPVPNGFCLTVRLFEEIMTHEKLREKKNNIFYEVDFDNINQIQKASQETQQLFITTPIPLKIEEIILEAYNQTFPNNKNIKLAVRSSAIGEDSDNYSFAGLHQSQLNVSRSNLVDACYEILISKYSPQSLVYRYISGLRDEDMPMSVGCIEMIKPWAAGVLYTFDPNRNSNDIIIQAVRGLGSLVVEGRAKPQEYIISRENGTILNFNSGNQEYINTFRDSDGVVLESIGNANLNEPFLSSETISTLYNYSLIIEKHFNNPQDIEWAVDSVGKVFILQARPLKTNTERYNLKENILSVNELDNKYKPLITTGDCASKGIGVGKVFIVKSLLDLKDCPKDAILVAKKNLPEFASLIHKLSGVITESGSTTGHLSIISREIGVPILTNVQNATKILHNGMQITIYSEAKRVYEGYILNELIEPAMIDDIIENPFRKSPIYRIFHRLSRFLFKLNLTNPNSEKFRPEYCETIHDIIRFAHENAMKEMFSLYESARTDSGKSYRLVFEVPLDIYLVDLGGGLKISNNSSYATKENIKSKPFLALIEGMTTPGIQWAGPLSVDLKGFMNIMMANITDSHKAERNVGSRSYALISDNYLNFFSRLGYHFSRLDAFATSEQNSNYINFHFRGGAADPIRKTRRAIAIQRILEEYGFSISRMNDNVIARLRKANETQTYELLKEIGRLMGAIRNTDVTMKSDEHIDIFVKLFLEGDPAPASKFLNN